MTHTHTHTQTKLQRSSLGRDSLRSPQLYVQYMNVDESMATEVCIYIIHLSPFNYTLYT